MALDVSVFVEGAALAGLVVRELTYAHTVSEAFSLRMRVLLTEPDLDLDDHLGRAVEVRLAEEPHLPAIHGVLHQIAQTSIEVSGLTGYELEIGPHAWLMTQRTGHRIFKDLDVIGIVRALAAEYGGLIPEPAVLTVDEHPVREFTVQYGETDLDFLRRILADEGIAFWFDHAAGGRLVLSDDTTSRSERLPASLPFVPKSHEHLGLRAPHVQTVAVSSTLRPAAVVLRDYDFEKPQFTVQGAALDADARRGEQEHYEFEVGNFTDDAAGRQRATQVLQERRADARILTCQTSTAMPVGVRFTLEGHPRRDFDGELFVRTSRIHLRDEDDRHLERNTATCIRAQDRFRPARLPKPRIAGTQTGFVVTEEGQDVDVDVFGRVEVEFKWDRRDTHTAGASRRVRVSQGWAGPGFGFVLLPRKGEEVLLAFLDGDPDEPIIVGRVHNGFTLTPLDLPAQKTQSIWKSRTVPHSVEGHNLIRMEDAAGSELLELRAQRDFRHETLRNADSSVGVDHSMHVGGTSKTNVVGAHSIESASTTIGTGPFTVSSSMTTIGATGNIKLEAGNNLVENSSDHQINTGKFWVAAKSIAQIASGVIKLLGGGASIVMQGGGIRITAPADITIEAGGTLTLKGAVVDVKGAPIKLNC